MQYQRLYQEMQDVAVAGFIQGKPKMKASRSLPAAFGMKQAQKTRVETIIDNIVQSKQCNIYFPVFILVQPSVFDHLVPKPSPIPAPVSTSNYKDTCGILGYNVTMKTWYSLLFPMWK